MCKPPKYFLRGVALLCARHIFLSLGLSLGDALMMIEMMEAIRSMADEKAI